MSRRSGMEKGKKKISRKMSSLYKDIQKQRRSERREVQGIIRKEERDKERFIRKHPNILAPPRSNNASSHRYGIQEEMGNISKVKRPEHRISRHQQNLSLYRNKKYGRDIETREMKHQHHKKYEALTTLSETSWIYDQRKETGFVELDGDDLKNKTEDLTQDEILEELDLNTRKNVFDIELPNQSGYVISYNKSGRHILLGGLRGHLSSIEWRKFKLAFEMSNVSHRISSVCWMMDDSMLSVAAKNWQTRIYDCDGSELHCVKKFGNVTRLEYLPYHLLLVGGVEETGSIHYLDISLGEVVSTVDTDPFLCMTQNSYNAMIYSGQRNGIVSMWTPRDQPKKPAVTMKCHDGGVTHIVTSKRSQEMQKMITIGLDYQLKVWDIRKTYSCLSQRALPFRPGPALALSDNDVLALSHNNQVMTYKNVFQTGDSRDEDEDDEEDAQVTTGNRNSRLEDVYLRFNFPHGSVTSLDFCPYEDVLGVGWSGGVRSVVIPGAGLPEIDSRQPNPYFNEKQLKNWNVERVIDKIPWEMICLDPQLIGSSGAGQARALQLRPEVQAQVSSLDFEMIRDEETNELTEKFFQLRRDQRTEMIRKENEEDLDGVKVKEWFEEEEKNPLLRFVGKRRKIEMEKERVRREKENQALGQTIDDEDDEDDDENVTGLKRKRKKDDDDDDKIFSTFGQSSSEKKRKLT